MSGQFNSPASPSLRVPDLKQKRHPSEIQMKNIFRRIAFLAWQLSYFSFHNLACVALSAGRDGTFALKESVSPSNFVTCQITLQRHVQPQPDCSLDVSNEEQRTSLKASLPGLRCQLTLSCFRQVWRNALMHFQVPLNCLPRQEASSCVA